MYIPIEIQQGDGATVLRFIMLPPEHKASGLQWYGGTVGDWARELMPFAHGPHVWHTIRSMLDLIAEIADMPPQPLGGYLVRGAAGQAYIGRHMDARELARAIGCAESDVTEHFERVVKVGGRAQVS